MMLIVEVFVTVTKPHVSIDAHVTTNVHGDAHVGFINATHFAKTQPIR